MTKFKSKTAPSAKKPKVSKPSASAVSVGPKSVRVAAPSVPAGEWVEVLNDRHGAYTLVLDYGAFRWLWDLVENRVVFGLGYAKKLGSDSQFSEAYMSAAYRTVDAFRDEATQHDDTHRAKVPPKGSQPPVVREAPLTLADHDAPKKTGKREAKEAQEVGRGRPKKSAPIKGRSKFKVKR